MRHRNLRTGTGIAFLILAGGIALFALFGQTQLQGGRLGAATGFALVGGAIVILDRVRSSSSG